MKVESSFRLFRTVTLLKNCLFWIFDYYKTALFNHTIYFKTNQLNLHRRQ